MTVPLAGWYPDPSGAADFRWWDGTTWTDSVTDDAEAPTPVDPQRLGGADEQLEDAGRGQDRRDEAKRGEGSRLVALVVAVTLVLSGGVAGVIGWREFQSLRSAARTGTHPAGHPSVTPTLPASATASNRSTRSGQDSVSGQLDEVTRRATLADASMMLPDDPYELVGNPITVPDTFDVMFVANAPVHPDFNGSETWAATVGIGHVPVGSWDSANPEEFGRRALTGISQQFFGYTPTSIRSLAYQPVTVGSAACAQITANVHYVIKGLASKFDRVRIIGCPDATDGSAIAAISSVPDDASATLTKLAAKSLATFTVR